MTFMSSLDGQIFVFDLCLDVGNSSVGLVMPQVVLYKDAYIYFE